MKKIKKLKTHQSLDKRHKFEKKIIKLIPEVKPYVRHRIYLAESLGMIPENMYQSTDIVDDAIIKIYETDITNIVSTTDLKILFFSLLKEELDQLFYNESKHKNDVSTDKILHQELNKLKERFTFNADGDFVMNEELNDISYHQKDFTPQLFIYEDAAQSVKTAFDLDYLDEDRKRTFTKLYHFLSFEASNVVDLHVFGRLSTLEIAQIKKTDESSIRAIILQIKASIYTIFTHKKGVDYWQ
jgi:DNA-directed RNA polymerase specialized sigma24 family protein